MCTRTYVYAKDGVLYTNIYPSSPRIKRSMRERNNNSSACLEIEIEIEFILREIPLGNNGKKYI